MRFGNSMRRVKAVAAIGLAAFTYGCGGGGEFFGPEGSFTFVASTRVLQVSPTRFEVRLDVTNPTTSPITVSVGCLGIVVHATAARTGAAVYDSRPTTACTLSQTTFQPQQTRTYTATATTANVLGTTGAAGVYYTTAALQIGTTTVVPSAGQVELRR